MKTFAIICSIFAGAAGIQVSTKQDKRLENEVEVTTTKVDLEIGVSPGVINGGPSGMDDHAWFQSVCNKALLQWSACCQEFIDSECPQHEGLASNDDLCHLVAGSRCTSHPDISPASENKRHSSLQLLIHQGLCSNIPQKCDSQLARPDKNDFASWVTQKK